jgi:hypothetical protein
MDIRLSPCLHQDWWFWFLEESALVQSTSLCLRQEGSSSLVPTVPIGVLTGQSWPWFSMMRLGDISADVAYGIPPGHSLHQVIVLSIIVDWDIGSAYYMLEGV